MRTLTIVLVCAGVLLAGCAARGDNDPFAYMRKPLYLDKFDLAEIQGDELTRQFWVTDGSIAQLHLQVWVNASAGGARVVVTDPSGGVAIDTTTTTSQRLALNLGAWSVRVEASADAVGDVGVHVTRM